MSIDDKKLSSIIEKATTGKELSIKQKRFVRAILQPGMDNVTAVKEAGYAVTSDASAKATARSIMQGPKVTRAINEILDELYPNAAADSINVLKSIINSTEESTVNRIRAIETLAKFQGWNAPSKHQHLTAKVDMSKYQLPIKKTE